MRLADLEHVEPAVGSVISRVDSAQVRHHQGRLVRDATKGPPLGDVCLAIKVDRDLRGTTCRWCNTQPVVQGCVRHAHFPSMALPCSRHASFPMQKRAHQQFCQTMLDGSVTHVGHGAQKVWAYLWPSTCTTTLPPSLAWLLTGYESCMADGTVRLAAGLSVTDTMLDAVIKAGAQLALRRVLPRFMP